MNEKSGFPGNIGEMEQEFRRLRKSTLEAYDRELEKWLEESTIGLEERDQRHEENRQVLAEGGIDLAKLDALERMQERRLDEFLLRVRPPLVDRPPQLDVHLRERTVRAAFYSSLGCSQASLIGADLLAPDIESLAQVEGELGNPSVWLYDANQVKDLQAARTGSGWGCWAYGIAPGPKAIWWYGWVPPQTGNYWIVASVDYNGFYILKADDSWYNCKNAELSASVTLEVHQYFWRGKREVEVIDKGGGNIAESSFLSGSASWSFHEKLGGGDVVWVKVCFAIDVDARGGGSYAELNFATGKANYISAPAVVILG